MNKKLVGGIIALVAVAALIIAVVATRPESKTDTGSSSSSDNSNLSENSSENNADDAIQSNQVQIEDFAYSPATIKIKKGTTVKWTNNDSVAHTVTGDDGGPDSELISQGQSYEFTFDEIGTFTYFCKPHPSMTGTVIVE